jgi:phosphoglycerate dehydrogenase-like enzyme
VTGSPVVVIATPLEERFVEQVRRAVPGVDLRYDPTLLPPPRYPSDHRGDESFRRSDEGERRWQSWLADAEVLFGVPTETPGALADVVRRCARLRWIQGTSAGAGEMLRRAGLDDAERGRVLLTTASGAHADQLAEWAMLGLLAFTKGLPRLLADKAARRWDHYPVRELRGQHLAVVGLGHIGRRTAEYAKALGMRVTGVRRAAAAANGAADAGVDALATVADLPRVLPECDAVVLALPGTPATEGLIGPDLLAALPAHAVVVNVGRGSVLDESALVEALREGRLAGAALDVFATEPLPADSPLWELPNVLLSPHTAALAADENARIVELFVENLRRYLDGRPLLNRVDPEAHY